MPNYYTSKTYLRVPKITKNLVSISKLTADNHIFIEFHSDFCLVKDKTTKNVLLWGRLKDGIYLLIEPQPTAASQNRKTPRPFASNSNMSISSYHPNNSCNSVCCSMIVSNDETNVWHRRLGHPSTKILSQVLKTCGSTYQYGKSHVLPFPSLETKTAAPFKLIHSDMWGASPVNSTLLKEVIGNGQLLKLFKVL